MPFANRVWLIADVNPKTRSLTRAYRMVHGSFQVGRPGGDPQVVLFWAEGPNMDSSLRLMNEELKNPRWDWIRPILEE